MHGLSSRKMAFGVAVILGLAALAFVTSGERTRLSGPEMAVRDGLAPAAGGISRVLDALRGWGRSFIALGGLRAENKLLQEEVARLTQENNELLEEQAENRRLRELLRLGEELQYTTLAARVIGRDPGNFFSVAVIDKGSSDGLRPGMVAVTPKGIVGRISAVTRRTSTLLLMTDPASAIGGIVQRSRSVVLIEGRAGASDTCVLKALTPDVDLQPGDRIITSGYGGVFPKGLVIGNVIMITKGTYGIGSGAIVRPAAELSRLEEVLVLIGQEAGL